MVMANRELGERDVMAPQHFRSVEEIIRDSQPPLGPPPFPEIDFGRRRKQEVAARWLHGYLSSQQPDYAASSRTILEEGRAAGHTEGTLRAAKKALGIQSYSNGLLDVTLFQFPSSAWSLLRQPNIRLGSKTYRLKPARKGRAWKASATMPNGSPVTLVADQESAFYHDDAKGEEPVGGKVVRGTIEVASFCLASQPWPGRTGPRNAQVMATLLKRFDRLSSLTTKVSLWTLADECGMGRWQSVKEALGDLQDQGLITFELGQPHEYLSGGDVESGHPSVVSLVPVSGEREHPVGLLPEASRDEFAHGALGHSGYVMAMRVIFEQSQDGVGKLAMSRAKIEQLTGCSASSVKRLVRNSVEAGTLAKDDTGKWYLVDGESLLSVGDHATKVQDRQTKRSEQVSGARRRNDRRSSRGREQPDQDDDERLDALRLRVRSSPTSHG